MGAGLPAGRTSAVILTLLPHTGTEVFMQDFSKFSEMPDSVRSIMKASIEQARKAFDTFVGAGQKALTNIEIPTTTDSMKHLNERIAEFTKMNAEANFRLAMKLADAREIGDVLKIQSQHAQELMDTYSKQLEELRELTTKIMKEATQAAAAVMPSVHKP